MSEPSIEASRKRYLADTEHHDMEVLLDEGVYRHLLFRHAEWRPPLLDKQRRSMYWFELVTVPGALMFNGDGLSFTFRRVRDMFEFFRPGRYGINPHYWAEKLTSMRDGQRQTQVYDPDVFRSEVLQMFVDDVKYGSVPPGKAVGKILRETVLEEAEYGEDIARKALHDFRVTELVPRSPERPRLESRVVYEMSPDFAYESSFSDYDWWFLWACHAIQDGVRRYDKYKAEGDT